MRFVIQIGDGRLEIVGNLEDTSVGEEYYRSGAYRLDGDQLISPVINQGQPATLALRGGTLSLTIDETLTLRLRRDLRADAGHVFGRMVLAPSPRHHVNTSPSRE
jgi:hypothetical protein